MSAQGSIVPFNRLTQAVNSAWSAFWNIWTQPQSPTAAFTPIPSSYDIWWAYYTNTIFEDPALWTGIYHRAGMYRHMRPVLNPVKRIVDFYAGAVFPGALSEDGSNLPEGVPLAIPLAEDTPPKLRKAIAQIWQWTNMQTMKSQIIRWSAALGECGIEIIDDDARGRVYFQLLWPGHVVELERDAMGNVKYYAIQYDTVDANGTGFIYRKEVDKDSYRTFKDGEKFAYDERGAEWENPYGFVPMVWLMHRDIGGAHGAPAFDGSFNKIARLMALASHIHDQVHKAIGAPIVLWTEGEFKARTLQPLSGGAVNQKRKDDASLVLDPESILILRGPQGGNAQSLLGNLQLGQALKVMESLQAEISSDQPVLRMYEQLRTMSQVTGPAASRLMGDAATYVYEASALADQAMISLLRMAVSIAGWRLSRHQDGWTTPTTQQQKFQGYDLKSYEKGDLDFSITQRPIFPITQFERAQTAVQFYTAALNAKNAGLPMDVVMTKLGWSADDITRLNAHIAEEERKVAAQQQKELDQKVQLTKITAAAQARRQQQSGQGDQGGQSGQAGQGGAPTSAPNVANRAQTPNKNRTQTNGK
jgi:hypothetical protein